VGVSHFDYTDEGKRNHGKIIGVSRNLCTKGSWALIQMAIKACLFPSDGTVNKDSFNFNLTMEDPSFDALLSWSMGELIEFPDIDFELFDSVFSTQNQDLSAAEVPELLPDYQPAAQDAVETLKSLVDELSSRVTMLEDQ
jgi:hypothetical protein